MLLPAALGTEVGAQQTASPGQQRPVLWEASAWPSGGHRTLGWGLRALDRGEDGAEEECAQAFLVAGAGAQLARIVGKWHRCVQSLCLCCLWARGRLTWLHGGTWGSSGSCRRLASAWLKASYAGQCHAHKAEPVSCLVLGCGLRGC